LTVCGPPLSSPNRYMDEWIEYHKFVGVDKFLLHTCNKDPEIVYPGEIMRKNIELGISYFFKKLKK
jgi:hypothetical protein